jgi:two-component system, NarL family, response regulator NreC
MNRTTILIVDDHAMVRKGLRLLLSAQEDLSVVGEAGSLAEAIDAARRLRPAIITLDLSMPGSSGVGSIERLRSAVPEARIVVVTMHDDPAYVRTALAMGARGYVNKSAADTELIAAVRAVARGRIFLDVGDAATLESILGSGGGAAARRGEASTTAPADALSDREREVLAAVARGYTNQQIADEVCLSVKTIESYRSRLMRKLGLKDRADLVRVAVSLGLVTDA